MSNLIQINKQETSNLLSKKSLLRNNPTIFFSASDSSNHSIVDTLQINNDALSFRTVLVQNVESGNNAQFNFGDALEFTAKRNGIHSFSFLLCQGNINANLPYDILVKLNLFVNDILTETFEHTVNLENNSPDLRLAQSFNLTTNDNVNFTFEVVKDSVGTPNPNIELFWTCFQLNYGDVDDYSTPVDYFQNTNKEYLGVYDYSNTLSEQSYTSTPIYLNNNGEGDFTNKEYAFSEIEDIFDTSINSFNFINLELGDKVDIRIDVDIQITTSNQHAKVSLELAIGATPYEISILDRDFKKATTHANITVSNFFYIGNEITKKYPAKLKFTSDASANITLNGFAVIVTKRK